MPTVESKPDQLSGSVRDVMTTKVHTATVGTYVPAVADLMATHNLRRIIVVNEKKHVCGVISQRDVVKALITHQEEGESGYLKLEVQEIFNRESPVTVTEDVRLENAAIVIANNKIGCLPVVNAMQQLCGVLSTSDLIQHLANINQESYEQAFEIYDPSSEGNVKKPAYIRKINGDIVIPLSNIQNKRARLDRVVLGFDPPSSRILIKFVRGNDAESISTTLRDGNLVIPAQGFVRHYELMGKSNAFQVEDHNHSKYLVLSPKKRSQA